MNLKFSIDDTFLLFNDEKNNIFLWQNYKSQPPIQSPSKIEELDFHNNQDISVLIKNVLKETISIKTIIYKEAEH